MESEGMWINFKNLELLAQLGEEVDTNCEGQIKDQSRELCFQR